MADEVSAQREKENQFFDRWMGRARLGSTFGAVAAAGAFVGLAVVAVLPPVAGIAAGLAAFAGGSKVVDHFRHRPKKIKAPAGQA